MPRGETVMPHFNFARIASVAIALIVAVSFLATAAAETTKVEGLIKARSGERMVVQTIESPNLVVLLTDYTEVGQVQGVLKARRKEMSMAALVPGLAINVEGMYNDRKQLVASNIKFKGDDLARAKSIQAGLHETQTQARQNREELEKQNAVLQAHNA